MPHDRTPRLRGRLPTGSFGDLFAPVLVVTLIAAGGTPYFTHSRIHMSARKFITDPCEAEAMRRHVMCLGKPL